MKVWGCSASGQGPPIPGREHLLACSGSPEYVSGCMWRSCNKRGGLFAASRHQQHCLQQSSTPGARRLWFTHRYYLEWPSSASALPSSPICSVWLQQNWRSRTPHCHCCHNVQQLLGQRTKAHIPLQSRAS